MDVSNGVFMGKTDLGDGYMRWDWAVHYPINSYSISMNVGDYVHFTDTYEDRTLNYYVLSYNLDKAKVQFTQAKGMLAAFEHYFGEYPFRKDGYKLVEASNAGMEHQSAVTYGNAAVTVAYRWQADEPAFAMPICVGSADDWQIIQPTTAEWKTLRSPLKKDAFQVATDLYFVNVSKE